ncbi:uncharacterized protein C8Q71DRAFT_863577 [Rhodofomes roseus]|uniref:Uncharacterized protein n=1 Tax=Rhodofomes roseus TaxID=34475 RepID=A0ABQ8JXY3_9APHY|nr:uncharacterized protein C8Q71DRAFT_863577 [Rhodofomes roseus]KAH9829022.1 hypothetical protein C8Q71DRAFT_863577 [Rhodofomes roseus]
MPLSTWLPRSQWDALSPFRELERAFPSNSAREYSARTFSSTIAPRGYPPPLSATPRDSRASPVPVPCVWRSVGTEPARKRRSALNARPFALDFPRPPPLSCPADHPNAQGTTLADGPQDKYRAVRSRTLGTGSCTATSSTRPEVERPRALRHGEADASTCALAPRPEAPHSTRSIDTQRSCEQPRALRNGEPNTSTRTLTPRRNGPRTTRTAEAQCTRKPDAPAASTRARANAAEDPRAALTSRASCACKTVSQDAPTIAWTSPGAGASIDTGREEWTPVSSSTLHPPPSSPPPSPSPSLVLAAALRAELAPPSTLRVRRALAPSPVASAPYGTPSPFARRSPSPTRSHAPSPARTHASTPARSHPPSPACSHSPSRARFAAVPAALAPPPLSLQLSTGVPAIRERVAPSSLERARRLPSPARSRSHSSSLVRFAAVPAAFASPLLDNHSTAHGTTPADSPQDKYRAARSCRALGTSSCPAASGSRPKVEPPRPLRDDKFEASAPRECDAPSPSECARSHPPARVRLTAVPAALAPSSTLPPAALTLSSARSSSLPTHALSTDVPAVRERVAPSFLERARRLPSPARLRSLPPSLVRFAAVPAALASPSLDQNSTAHGFAPTNSPQDAYRAGRDRTLGTGSRPAVTSSRLEGEHSRAPRDSVPDASTRTLAPRLEVPHPTRMTEAHHVRELDVPANSSRATASAEEGSLAAQTNRASRAYKDTSQDASTRTARHPRDAPTSARTDHRDGRSGEIDREERKVRMTPVSTTAPHPPSSPPPSCYVPSPLPVSARPFALSTDPPAPRERDPPSPFERTRRLSPARPHTSSIVRFAALPTALAPPAFNDHSPPLSLSNGARVAAPLPSLDNPPSDEPLRTQPARPARPLSRPVSPSSRTSAPVRCQTIYEDVRLVLRTPRSQLAVAEVTNKDCGARAQQENGQQFGGATREGQALVDALREEQPARAVSPRSHARAVVRAHHEQHLRAAAQHRDEAQAYRRAYEFAQHESVPARAASPSTVLTARPLALDALDSHDSVPSSLTCPPVSLEDVALAGTHFPGSARSPLPLHVSSPSPDTLLPMRSSAPSPPLGLPSCDSVSPPSARPSPPPDLASCSSASALAPQRETLAQFWGSFMRKPQVSTTHPPSTTPPLSLRPPLLVGISSRNSPRIVPT